MKSTIGIINQWNARVLLTGLTLTVAAVGCVHGGEIDGLGDEAATRGEDSGTSAGVKLPDLAIAQPVFYESNENGEVIGGPVPDAIDDLESYKNAGSRPIHVQKYGPFGNGGTLSTGFPTSSWVAVVVGIDTTDGDINEVGVGNPLRAFPFQSNGIWNVTFDLRSHRDNESWSIWIMYIQRSMATATNF
ncbi:MAG: hypothetical protein MJE77_45615 [Proteobacteria bacterium]|nr:hypothetical protein [Pseudomonadota bacterium]